MEDRLDQTSSTFSSLKHNFLAMKIYFNDEKVSVDMRENLIKAVRYFDEDVLSGLSSP